MNLTELFAGLCLNPDEALLEALIKAHYTAARDNANLSKQVVGEAAMGSLDFSKALAAGIMAQGGTHGPVIQARKLLRHGTPEKVSEILSDKRLRIPGWGNSFFKETIDPAWHEVAEMLRQRPIWKKIEMIDAIIKKHGKNIFPNAGIFSAACMEELKWLDGAELVIILVGRLPIWGLEFARVTQACPSIADIS